MRFLHPEFLWFLFFALIPVVLFFLNLQKVKKVEFTNVDFISDVKKETSNRFQTKRILITLSRVLFVLFFVLAFSQPTFKEKKEFKAVHYLIYFDNSLSMTRSLEESQLIDKAKVLLPDVVSSGRRNKYSFISNSELNINQDFPSKADLLKQVSSIKPCNSQLSLEEILGLARRKNSDLDKKLVIISDFQSSQFTTDDLELLKDTTSMDLEYKLVALRTQQENVFVDSVWVDGKYLSLGTKVKVHGRLVNSSLVQKDVLVKCFAGQSQVSSTVVSAGGNQSVEFSLETPVSKNGVVDFRLEVDDPLVLFDNDYHFVLEVGKSINVLILKDNNRSFSEVALKNEGLFNVNSYNYNKFNSSELQKADLVILEGVNELSKLPITDLKSVMKSGKSIVLIPSVNGSISNINSFLTSLGLPTVVENKLNDKKEIDTKALESHPFFVGVFESTTQKVINPWYIPEFTITGGKAIIKSRTGNSFFSKINKGRGEFYLYNTAFDSRVTNFNRHSLFVPTQYLIAMSSKSNGNKVAYFTSEKKWLLQDVNPSSVENYSVVNSVAQFVPSQSVKGNDLELEVVPNMKSGVYDVQTRTSKLTSIAVNYGRAESYLESQDLSSLDRYKNVELVDFDSEFELQEDEASIFPWWKWLILVALFWLFVETVLLRFFK